MELSPFEELTVPHLIKKRTEFYGILTFATVVTKADQLSYIEADESSPRVPILFLSDPL